MPEQLATIRENAKAAMVKQNLSARKLALKAGLPKRAVLDFLNSTRPTRESTVRLICLELGLDSDCSHDKEITVDEVEATA